MDEALRRIFQGDQQQAFAMNWSPITGLLLGVYRAAIVDGASVQEASIIAGITFRELMEMAKRNSAEAASAESEDNE